MTNLFYDTHAHLDFPEFASELPEVIERARAAGIVKLISIGTTLDSSRRAVQISEQYPQVFAAVGWHPSHVEEAPADIRAELSALAVHPKVVAIGETGLDYYRLPSTKGGSSTDDETYKARQLALFQQQLEVAAAYGLNCVIHERTAFEDTYAALLPHSTKVRGVFHCYVNTPENLRRILELGSLVSFTGIVTFKNAENVRESLRAVPDGKFMLETDCPFLAPVPYRGKRCESAYVKETAEFVASVRGCTIGHLSTVTCSTAHQFFPKLRIET